MKRFLCAAIMYLLVCKMALAGADTLRYRDIIFKQVRVDSVVYSTPDGKQLYLDVYQPIGDTAHQRPLIILAHGGSFMHGSRHDENLPVICKQLAMRGFVAASIDYRLTNLLGMASKRKAYTAIIKAVADGRNCVRWFRRNAVEGNVYHINPDKIFFGGTSAGAILAEHLAYIDSPAKCKSTLGKVVKKYMCNEGNLSVCTIKGCISLAGAILDTNLISNNGPALLHIQGDADHIVPYLYKHPINGIAPFKLAGLGASRGRYKSQHLDFTEYVFIKAGHTPWDYDKKALNIVIEQMIGFVDKELK